MKKYTTPEIEITLFATESIMADSETTTGGGSSTTSMTITDTENSVSANSLWTDL